MIRVAEEWKCTRCGYEWTPEESEEAPECPACNGEVEIDRSCPECGEYDGGENGHKKVHQRHKCPEHGYYLPVRDNDNSYGDSSE